MTLLKRINGNQRLMRLVGGGSVGVLIKGSAAGLSLAMFAALAWVTDTESFGVIGFCFSLATLLAVAGSFGQRMMSLKDAAIARDTSENTRLTLIGQSSTMIVALGTLLFSLLLLPARDMGIIDLDLTVFVAMAGLAVTLALAENTVHFFRGYRSIAFALIPRDILWRLSVIAVCMIALIASFTVPTTPALWVLSLPLLGLICAQLLSEPALRDGSHIGDLISEGRRRVRNGLPFWGTSMIQTVSGPVLAPVILGVMMSPDAVGPFFAAFRIALVLDLFTLAAGMVVAPLVAKGHANSQYEDMQASLRYSVLLVSAATLICFLIIVFFGENILALMNPDFTSAAPALTVLGLGFLIAVLCGPVPNIMELAGLENLLFKRLIWFNLACLVVLVPATQHFGMMGAAVCSAGLRAAVHITLLFTVKSHLRIDPSIFSLWHKAK
ncbi:lipopolysaccharide biosynthesis protein [Ruegeria arenilitoris]|uniref:lipopolysaccharide biosynthesis protein n=1 Tax=Ruegeria arenilitoris TaxID=1173585 RepID=UPI00147B4073|nr:lipopolysaccharide biosynthesis protein [Ruegeria arenilitoris]